MRLLATKNKFVGLLLDSNIMHVPLSAMTDLKSLGTQVVVFCSHLTDMIQLSNKAGFKSLKNVLGKVEDK